MEDEQLWTLVTSPDFEEEFTIQGRVDEVAEQLRTVLSEGQVVSISASDRPGSRILLNLRLVSRLTLIATEAPSELRGPVMEFPEIT